MQRPFREHHLLELLNLYEASSYPLDLYVSFYFKDNPSLGSKDRAEISETIYNLVRWKGLIDYLCKGLPTWEKRLEIFKTLPRSAQELAELPPHIQVSFPEELFNLIKKDYGLEDAMKLCLILNEQAPTTIRANTLKISRDKLLEQFSPTFDVAATECSTGILFRKKTSFFSLKEFKEGLFEVQDEASQLVADLVDCKSGDLVLDYCSGSGGKTLAFAPKLKGSGQIYLHDIRPRALLEAKKRLKRAGIQNCQTIQADSEQLKKLKKKMDWVLVDAPCTGTGTLRRNPDQKWRFTEDMLQRLTGQQRVIFEKALSFVKPNGHIVYATCSLLKDENEAQVEHFLKTYPLKLISNPFKTLPEHGQKDGFFAAVFSLIAK